MEYNIDAMLFHLKYIKRMCRENEHCNGCPFRIKNNWAEYCMFTGPHWGEGVNPEYWELDDVNKKEGE